MAERQLLELLFADDQLRRTVLAKLTADDFANLPTAGLFEALLRIESEGVALDFENLSQQTEGDELASELAPLLLMSDSAGTGDEDSAQRFAKAERCLETLRLMKVDHRIDELRSELAAAERNGDGVQLDRLATEQVELTRRRNTLLPRADVG